MQASSCFRLSTNAREILLGYVWQVLEEALDGNGFTLPPAPNLDELLLPAACFVTLEKNGLLRGCIGTMEATEPLWLNVCKNAYASGFRDSRFTPLRRDECETLSVEISVLSPLTAMENEGEHTLIKTLTPNVDGLLLQDASHRAVFLPSVWKALPTPELFVHALKRKGGWQQDYWSGDIVIHIFTTDLIMEASD